MYSVARAKLRMPRKAGLTKSGTGRRLTLKKVSRRPSAASLPPELRGDGESRSQKTIGFEIARPKKCARNALTPLAKSDIFETRSYIADDNVEVADRVERALFSACEFLAESPLRCHFRRDITPLPLRFWTLTRAPNYTVVDRPETAPLQVTVLHGKRNIRRILTKRPVHCATSLRRGLLEGWLIA